MNPLSEGLVAWWTPEKTMTESEWLASEAPVAMLDHVRDKISDRKQRRFVEACRRIENIPSSFQYDLATPDGLRSAVAIWRGPSVSVSNAIRAAILRDLLGNPWRPVTLPSPWLTQDVVQLATAAYGDRREDGTLDTGCLLALSDALEEAEFPTDVDCGRCGGHGWFGKLSLTSASKTRPCDVNGCCFGRAPHPLLAHLRSPGPHYRGCWSVDLILGES